MPDLRIAYACHFGSPSGYARAAYDYLMALRAAGVDLAIPLTGVPSKHLGQELDPCYTDLLDYVGWAPPWLPTHIIVHAMPPAAISTVRAFREGLPPRGESPQMVCITTWETDHLPLEICTELAELFDLVIVPSEHCRNAIEFGGASDHPFRPTIIPHAIDCGFWFEPKTWERLPTTPYVFYTIGVWGDRKNIEGVLRAYLTGFREKDNVVLRVICPEVDRNAVEAIQRASGMDSFGEIEFFTERLSLSALRSVHRDGDCYVSASRGEGWGLGAFEATAMGNPVIIPKWGGSLDFIAGEHAWNRLVPGVFTPCLPMSQEIGATVRMGDAVFKTRTVKSIAAAGVRGDQAWFEPSLDELREKMMLAREQQLGRNRSHPHFDERFVEETRSRFRRDYSYDAVGKELVRVLKGGRP